MRIRGILFDAADVLYRRPEPTSAYVSRLLAESGYTPELSAHDWARQRALRSQAKSGLVSPDEYWDQRLQMHGVDDPAVRRALAERISAYSDQVLPIPGGAEALSVLKQRGFILGIVTDTIHPIERKQRWLDAVGVGQLIDVLACSTALGVHKPEPAIYWRAVQEAGLTPGEAAFVGHAADELEGARNAGLTTVAVYHDPHATADYYAASLLDLLDVAIFQERDTHRAET